MSPRRYSMSVRAEQAAQTRDRILAAALACYRGKRMSATSLQAIARRADVSAGTILNQFGSADALADAVVEQLSSSLRVPDDRGWPDEAPAQRVQRLVAEMFEFYERSRPWFDTFRAELGEAPALRDGEAAYRRTIGELYGRVFGGALAEDRVRAAIVGLTNPSTFVALREAGMSVRDAAELIAETRNRTVSS